MRSQREVVQNLIFLHLKVCRKVTRFSGGTRALFGSASFLTRGIRWAGAHTFREQWNRKEDEPAFRTCLDTSQADIDEIEALTRERYSPEPEGLSPDQRLHFRTATSPILCGSFEDLHRIASERGIRSEFPFIDADLAEFCLGLPASEKFGKEGPRRHLRRAMKGILPDTVLQRSSKTDFAPVVAKSLQNHYRDLLGAVIQDKELRPFVRTEALHTLIMSGLSSNSKSAGTEGFLWRLATLHLVRDRLF